MNKLIVPLYSHNNGTFIMIGVFALVIIGLVGAVLLMMGSEKKKKKRPIILVVFKFVLGSIPSIIA